MALETGVLENIILPSLAPNEVLSESWVRQFLNKLKARSDNQIEATRMLVRTLEEDYQTADTYLSAGFSEEIGVLTDAQAAQATRVTTLEAQVQTPTTGLLARVTVTENAYVTLNGIMSAYYGIKVAAGTNIATIELLATGAAASAVVITAGQIQLNGDVVVNGTLTYTQLAANTITTASDYEDDVGILVGYAPSGYSWNTVATVAVTTVDATTRVLVSWAVFLGAGNDGSVCEARIQRNGVTVWGPCTVAGNPPDFAYTFDTEGYIAYTPLFNGMVSAFDTDVPGAAGNYTYTLQMAANSALATDSWYASFRRMVATVFKR